MKRILLVLGFCLFVSSMADAECAWVLWKKYERVGENRTVNWEVISAVPQYQDCLKMQKRVLYGEKAFWKKNLKESVEITDWMISIKTKDGIGMLTYECLPDTTDPRK
jgi:hypothetical protein